MRMPFSDAPNIYLLLSGQNTQFLTGLVLIRLLWHEVIRLIVTGVVGVPILPLMRNVCPVVGAT